MHVKTIVQKYIIILGFKENRNDIYNRAHLKD